MAFPAGPVGSCIRRSPVCTTGLADPNAVLVHPARRRFSTTKAPAPLRTSDSRFDRRIGRRPEAQSLVIERLQCARVQSLFQNSRRGLTVCPMRTREGIVVARLLRIHRGLMGDVEPNQSDKSQRTATQSPALVGPAISQRSFSALAHNDS